MLDTDGDGVREYDGTPLRITYQTSTNPVRQATQSLIRDWWKEIGIETELIDHDAGVFFGGDPVEDKETTLRRFFADVQMYTSGTGIDPQGSLSGPDLQADSDAGRQLGAGQRGAGVRPGV